MPKGRRARWIMELQQYHFTIEHRSGKHNANADALSRMYINEEEDQSGNECFLALGYETDSENGGTGKIIQPTPCNTCGEITCIGCLGENFSEDSDAISDYSAYRFIQEAKRRKAERYQKQIQREEKGKRPIYMANNSSIIPYEYTPKEIDDIFLENLKEKQVIAGQPITTGGSKCTFYCDTENHHIHNYCKACKQNLAYGAIAHNCVVGFTQGKRRPEMNPRYLISVPWWREPLAVQQENTHTNYQEIPYYNFTLILSLPYEPYIADLD